MKINYHDSNRSITIEDSIYNRYTLRFILIMNLINSLLRIISFKFNPIDFLDYLWIVIGAISIIGIPYDYLKRTTSSKIQVDNIDSLIEKT